MHAVAFTLQSININGNSLKVRDCVLRKRVGKCPALRNLHRHGYLP